MLNQQAGANRLRRIILCEPWSLSHITLNRWLSVALPSGRRRAAAQPKSPGATPGQHHPGLDGVGSLQQWARYSMPWVSPPGFFLSSDLADWFQWMVPIIGRKSWVLGRGTRAIACLQKVAQPLSEQKLIYHNRKVCLEASSGAPLASAKRKSGEWPLGEPMSLREQKFLKIVHSVSVGPRTMKQRSQWTCQCQCTWNKWTNKREYKLA